MDFKVEDALTIRYADASDAETLAELGARTFRETFADVNSPEDMRAYLSCAFTKERLASELSDERSVFFVAESGGVATGYAKLRAGKFHEGVKGAKPVEIERLYVAREWLGRGAGHALMQACLDEACRRGYRTVWLGVWERNERARAFYRKWGFRDVGEQIFQLGSDAQTDVVMERSI